MAVVCANAALVDGKACGDGRGARIYNWHETWIAETLPSRENQILAVNVLVVA